MKNETTGYPIRQAENGMIPGNPELQYAAKNVKRIINSKAGITIFALLFT